MAIEREVDWGEAECSAMILAAGLGTRLRPLTSLRAKAVVPFLNRPLLDFSLDWLQRCGFCEVVINLHHLAGSVTDAYREHRFELDIHFNVEERILGTAGGPRDVLDRLGERVLIVNGDVATTMALGALWRRHRDTGALATMALHAGRGAAAHPGIEVEEDGRIARIPGVGAAGAETGATETSATERGATETSATERGATETSAAERGATETGAAAAGCFAGVHIVERRLLECVPEGRFCGIVDPLYARALDAGLPLYAAVVPGSWYEIGTVARYREAQIEALRREDFGFPVAGARRIARGGWVREPVAWTRAGLVAPFFLDAGTQVEEGALVEAVVAGRWAYVGCGATVRDSILMERSWVGAGARVERCVLMEAAVVAPGARHADEVIEPATARQAG